MSFPAISTGVYGYPVELAAPIALREAGRAPAELAVTFVLFSEPSLTAFRRAAADLGLAVSG